MHLFRIVYQTNLNRKFRASSYLGRLLGRAGDVLLKLKFPQLLLFTLPPPLLLLPPFPLSLLFPFMFTENGIKLFNPVSEAESDKQHTS